MTRRRALAASDHLTQHKAFGSIYNSAALSILLYGLETWTLNKTLAARIDGFNSRALRTIENIRWPQRVSPQSA